MRNRLLLLILAVILGVIVLVACAPAQAPSPTAAPAPKTEATPAAPAAAPPAAKAPPATVPAAGGIPAIPASHQPIEQRKDCLACHKQGGFMPAPPNHAGRTSDICTSCHQAAPAATPPVAALSSAKADKAPTVDAQVDDVWSKAKPTTIRVNGGVNKSETDVVLKSVYTQDMVYFLAQYKDPTESYKRLPWQKQADGTWKQLRTGQHENTYYEDKFALLWNIGDSIKNFNTQGCAVTCHATTAGRDRPLKYTNAAGELGDIWHAKMVRTLPVGHIDDQYVNDDQKADEGGRKSDARTGGGYSNNAKEGSKTPPFALPNNKPAPPYWILDSEKAPFDDSKYKANDEVPGIIIAPFQGDRGDIGAKAAWKDGTWTLEWGRKLDTGSKTDIQFKDLTKPYYFGVAVFDNTQIGHAVQYGVTKFTFEQ